MTRPPSRLALSLLRRYVPDHEPLVGDIVEQYADRPSPFWLWSQVVAAVTATLFKRDDDIRPLQLVDQQPLEAIERTLEVHRRRREVSPTPNPLPGGLGLVILGGLVTALAPVVWVGLLITFLSAFVLAALLVAVHKRHDPGPTRRLT